MRPPEIAPADNATRRDFLQCRDENVAKINRHCPARTVSFVDRTKGEKPMCPVCIANMALVIAGATSTGGFTAFVVKKLRTRRDTIKRLTRSNRED
jgi:hypothetical protein